MMAARLLAYRRRWFVIAWLLLLIALSRATVSAYQSTYSTPQQLQSATDLAQNNAATVLLFGDLHSSGTPAVMFTWEVGAIATILAVILAVLLAVSMTRAADARQPVTRRQAHRSAPAAWARGSRCAAPLLSALSSD